ncbi:hypothetical protein VKT23_016894 [Stygiomarasmius scandens]|uniref:Uncharacterized protein n=1 Tax=Marasmiellus scandens TaxID=2682957 RepID=A0ABR1IY34_9AGAR
MSLFRKGGHCGGNNGDHNFGAHRSTLRNNNTHGTSTGVPSSINHTSASKSSTNIIIILSSVLGALALLVSLGLVLIWLRRGEERCMDLAESYPDERGPTVNQAAKDPEESIYSLTLPQPIPNPVRSSKEFDIDHHQEGIAGMRAELRQQQNAETEQSMKFEEESVDRPPSYVSR